MTRHLPISPEPFELWPDAVQAAWAAGIARESWSDEFTRSLRRVYARFRGFVRTCSSIEVDEARIKAYAEALLLHVTPSTAVTYIEHLAYALQVAEPGIDRGWLIPFCREMRQRHIPRPVRTQATWTRSHVHGLPVSEWPDDVRSAWMQALRPREGRRYRDRRKSESGPTARWSKAYVERVARGYGMYLRATIGDGLGHEPTPDGIDRFCEVTEPRVSSVSLASYVWEIYQAAVILFPSKDWSWLRGDAEFLRRRARPSRHKESRIARISELRKLALTLLQEVETWPLRVGTAVAHRNALMLLVLTYKPARCRNISEMRWGSEIIIGEAGGSFFFPETKNRAPDGHPIDPVLAGYLRRHWERYRPLLAGARETDRLWLSKHGDPLSVQVISKIVGDLTWKHLKRRIPPHFFRDSVATSIAEHGTDMPGATAVLLGHRDPRSSETYEKHAQTIQAACALDALLEPYRLPPIGVRG